MKKPPSCPAWLKVSSDLLQLKREWSSLLLLTSATRENKSLSRTRRMEPEYNVVGVGLGEKVTNGKGQKTLCLRFLVRKKYSQKSLSAKNGLPKSIDGFPTDIVEVGTPRGLQPSSSISHPPHGPIAPGCSVSFAPSSPAGRTAGTVAAIVTDGSDHFILSANHVLGDTSHAPIGTPVLHPGSLDGPAPQRIGELTAVVPMALGSPNRLDCAIARLDPKVLWTSEIPGLGHPAEPMRAFPGLFVSKVGRTTGLTNGLVSINITADINVELRHGVYSMDDQAEILDIGTSFASGGDSGSLVVDTVNKRPVGIICAKAHNLTYMSPIIEILSSLRVGLAKA